MLILIARIYQDRIVAMAWENDDNQPLDVNLASIEMLIVPTSPEYPRLTELLGDDLFLFATGNVDLNEIDPDPGEEVWEFTINERMKLSPEDRDTIMRTLYALPGEGEAN